MSKDQTPLRTEVEILQLQISQLDAQLRQLNEDTKANIFLNSILTAELEKLEN